MSLTQCIQCGLDVSLANEFCPRCDAQLQTYSHTNPRPLFNGTFFRNPIAPGVEVGSVLGAALKLFGTNLWLIAKLVFLVYAPFEIFRATSLPRGDIAISSTLLALLGKVLITPSLIYALTTTLQTGSSPHLSESFRWGVNRIAKFSLCVFIFWTVQIGGTVLCLIPGIIALVALDPLYPIASLERGGPVQMAKRSWELTRGHRWNIFGATLVMYLLCGMVTLPASMVQSTLSQSGQPMWPLQAAAALLADFASQATTVLSLVIYLSILASRHEQPNIQPYNPGLKSY